MHVRVSPRTIWWWVGGVLLFLAGLGFWYGSPWRGERTESRPRQMGDTGRTSRGGQVVRVDADQEKLFGLEMTEVKEGPVSSVLDAPGQVIPDEARFAYITPRAEGVVRLVSAQIGQHVNKGELLALIDSTRVAQARLSLVNSLQRFEIARARLNWEETIYRNSLDMIEVLRKGLKPEEVQWQFANRAVGRTREELMGAYARFFLSRIMAERYDRLQEKDAIATSMAEQKRAELQVDKANFQGLMDRIAFEVTLEYTRARQALQEAQTAVRVAHQTLRVLGVSVDEIIERFQTGQLTAEVPASQPSQTLQETARSANSPSLDLTGVIDTRGKPVSTYELRAPFEGTILERERIVPGVVVGATHHLFTMANLDEVWVEAHVHESDFDLLAGGEGGRVEFTSPAYPDRVFRGRVLYTGDMVDPKSRAIRLLATARNPGHRLKPGMFVTIAIHSEQSRRLPRIPQSALLTDGDAYVVFVAIGSGRYERRAVEVGSRASGSVAILQGLRPGERVVTAGAFELKAAARAAATAEGAAP